MSQALARTVGELMIDEPAVVDPDDTLDVARSIMMLADSRHVPVVRGGRLEGIVSERDLLAAQLPRTRTRDQDREAHLHSLRVREVMTLEPRCARPDQSVEEAAALMRQHRISCLPVTRGQELLGIVTTTDLVALATDRMWMSGGPVAVSRLMTPRPLVSAKPTDRLDLAELLMRFGHLRHLPVLDGGRLVGMLSDRDILAAVRSRLERLSPAERLQDRASVRVDEIMTRDPWTTQPDEDAAQAGRRLLEHRIGALPVLRKRRLSGMLSETDFLSYLIDADPGASFACSRGRVANSARSRRPRANF